MFLSKVNTYLSNRHDLKIGHIKSLWRCLYTSTEDEEQGLLLRYLLTLNKRLMGEVCATLLVDPFYMRHYTDMTL